MIRVAILLVPLALIPTVSNAQDRVAPILPDALRWFAAPGIDGLEATWVLGAEDQPGPYLLRVRLADGGRIPPHTHPDERTTTVLSGVLHVGLGTTFDPDALVAVPAGGVYVIAAGAPHFLWARAGAVTYQESGVGPTATQPYRVDR